MTAPAAAEMPLGMRPAEYDRLRELLATHRPKRTLEIGLANGGSACVICQHLAEAGGEGHTAVDPFQSDPKGFSGRGVEAVKGRGFGHLLTVVEDFGHLTLPRLVAEGKTFQFVLVDGWHSFDYTLIDLFFADLLLEPGGVLAVHDTGWPAVYKACRFLETHKPYDRLSPPPSVALTSLPAKLARRVGQVLTGTTAEAADRRTRWFSLAAYKKRESRQVPDDFFADF